MEVLVLGRPTPERDEVVRRLEPAGAVHACRDDSWGCAELVDGCPLDRREVDVAVLVADQLGRVDVEGVACAQRARVPVLAVGDDVDERIAGHVTGRVGLTGDLAAAAAEAAADTSAYVREVEHELAGHLEHGDSILVRVVRRRRAIMVTLVGELDARRAAALADRARAAVRRYDDRVAVIDVTVESPGPDAANR